MKDARIPEATRVVFFDAVGTVLHPNPDAATVYARAASRHGLDYRTEDIATRFRDAFRAEELADEQAGWVTNEEREVARWRSIVNRTLPGAPAACFDDLYQHFARPDAWSVPADAVAVFEHLANRGLKLGLASNYDSRLNSVLAGHPELSLLSERVVISSQIGIRKPGTGFFDCLTSLVNYRRELVLLIGDDYRNDFQGATAFGMRAILLDPKGRHPEVTERVTSLRDLIS